MMTCRIQEMPLTERPRERLERLGPEALRNAELVAILLRTGLKGHSALNIAEELLHNFRTLEALARASLSSLACIKGVGRIKATQLVAAFALGARLQSSLLDNPVLDTPQSLFELLGNEMRLLDQECVRVVLLNARARLLAIEEISRGSLNECLAHPREVIRPVITRGAYGFVLVHNHPSGDPDPSMADRALTTRLQDVAQLMQVRFFDHLILGSAECGRLKPYYSFREAGCLA